MWFFYFILKFVKGYIWKCFINENKNDTLIVLYMWITGYNFTQLKRVCCEFIFFKLSLCEY